MGWLGGGVKKQEMGAGVGSCLGKRSKGQAVVRGGWAARGAEREQRWCVAGKGAGWRQEAVTPGGREARVGSVVVGRWGWWVGGGRGVMVEERQKKKDPVLQNATRPNQNQSR